MEVHQRYAGERLKRSTCNLPAGMDFMKEEGLAGVGTSVRHATYLYTSICPHGHKIKKPYVQDKLSYDPDDELMLKNKGKIRWNLAMVKPQTPAKCCSMQNISISVEGRDHKLPLLAAKLGIP